MMPKKKFKEHSLILVPGKSQESTLYPLKVMHKMPLKIIVMLKKRKPKVGKLKLEDDLTINSLIMQSLMNSIKKKISGQLTKLSQRKIKPKLRLYQLNSPSKISN